MTLKHVRAIMNRVSKELGFEDLFVKFGQNVCRPVGPRCSECPISRFCAHAGS